MILLQKCDTVDYFIKLSKTTYTQRISDNPILDFYIKIGEVNI